MFSNGAGMPSKTLAASQIQFDELLAALSISAPLSSREKLAKLRSVKPAEIIAATEKLKYHEFRSWSDDAFIRRDLFSDIDSGAFAARMRERNVQLIMGECAEEHFLYGTWRPPKQNTRASTIERLEADYPAPAIEALMKRFYSPDGKLPTWQPCKDWKDAYGRIYADLQVHAMERGFADRLVADGAGDLLHRYRIEWRAKCIDSIMPPEWGATHHTDIAIWLWGNGIGDGLLEAEKPIVAAMLKPFAAFLEGKKVDWGADAGKGEIRRLTAEGKVDVWEDGDWERGLEVWRISREVLKKEAESSSKL